MALTKQAKTLNPEQITTALAWCATSRHPRRDRVMVLLSVRAGLRAKEIASITWAMLTDAQQRVASVLELQNTASKGKRGGRQIPLSRDLQAALIELQAERGDAAQPDQTVIHAAESPSLTPLAVRVWFFELYQRLGFIGASSHSGRRTFATRVARNIVQCGGSLKDLQLMLGHASLTTTERYIEGSSEAQSRVVDLIAA